MILQNVGHQMLCLGICCANDTQKVGVCDTHPQQPLFEVISCSSLALSKYLQMVVNIGGPGCTYRGMQVLNLFRLQSGHVQDSAAI